MFTQDDAQQKGTFNYIYNHAEYELESHHSNIIVEEIESIFPDNNDLILCSVRSTCNTVMRLIRPGMHVVCNKNDLVLVAKVDNKSIWYIPHYKIIGKITKKIKTTIPDKALSQKTVSLKDFEF